MRHQWILSVAVLLLAACGGDPGNQDNTGDEADEVATEPMLRALPVRAAPPTDPTFLAGEVKEVVGTNVNASKEAGPQSETDIAIDPTDGNHLIGGSNDIAGANMRFYESFDGGKTWTNKALPLAPAPFDSSTSDPGVGFDKKGDVFYSFLGIDASGNTSLFVSKKPHGATAFEKAVQAPNVGADKELLTVDQTGTKFANTVYVSWDDNTATAQRVELAHSTDGGKTFSSKKVNHSGANVIGADPAVGPNGEVYVAWSNYASGTQKLFINRSLDGGKTFESTDHSIHHWVAATAGGLSVTIPADPQRGVSVFASIDVDRSGGPHNGTVYCAYNDATSKNGLDIFVRKSTDGGHTWSAQKRVNDDPTGVVHDQFMPRLAVDQKDGSVSIAFYDTRRDPANKKTDLFSARSTDGATTFAANVRVTSKQSDESTATADANGYGDYLGIASANGVTRPFWTDGRTGNEEAFSASVTP